MVGREMVVESGSPGKCLLSRKIPLQSHCSWAHEDSDVRYRRGPG